jgi:lipopolysaccharide transport system ATP-binding protein
VTTTAISLDNVSMKFILHHRRAHSFQDALVNLVHRRNGATEEFWALRGVTFDVHHGETVGIIGQNGSGKSTILKLVTRILDPTSGAIVVNGRVSALIELGAGFHPDLSGRENIYLNGSILGFSRAEMDRRYKPIVEFAELERFIDTPVKHYSSGMYMRLGFSVAISVDPDILIIDEVLSVGDVGFQRKCLDRISEFRRRGKAIIFVSHGIDVVSQLCDRVVWLDQGVVQSIGRAAHETHLYTVELARRDEEKREQAKNRTDNHEGSVSPAQQDSEILGVELIESEIYDANGTPTAAFRTGAALRFRMRGRVVGVAIRPMIGFSLFRGDGLIVHRSAPRPISTPTNSAGDFVVEVLVTSMPLLAGDYQVVPYVIGEDRQAAPINATEFSCSFSVWSDADDRGLVSLDYRWLDPADIAAPTSPSAVR